MKEQQAFTVPDDVQGSAPRGRQGHYTGIHPTDVPRTTSERTQRTMTAYPEPVAIHYDADDQYDDQPSTSSARRYAPIAPNTPRQIMRVTRHSIPLRRRATTKASQTEPVTQPPIGRPHAAPRLHWLVYVSLALFVMLAGWMLFSAVGAWWQQTLDDIHYGRPRTANYDVRVGHSDNQTASHFTAENLNGHVVIFELQGGNVARTKIYDGPTSTNADLQPVTLEFKSVTSAHRLDMLIHFNQGVYVLVNDTDTFRAPKPGEVVNNG